MASNFGFLAKFDFLQTIASVCISSLNPAIVHNVEKYWALKKVHYLTCVEHLEGDYLEFGVFTGSSLTHSIRCSRKMEGIYPAVSECRFFGYDSFEGFGDLAQDDKHPFYTDENFATSYTSVNRRVKAVAGSYGYRLVKGFFSETLKDGAAAHGISKSRIIFIDSDTYSSSKEALTYALPTVQKGTYIILDDFFSYKGAKFKGVARAFDEFLLEGGIAVRKVLDYGMGGAVFVVNDIGS